MLAPRRPADCIEGRVSSRRQLLRRSVQHLVAPLAQIGRIDIPSGADREPIPAQAGEPATAPPRREARPEFVEVVPVAVVPARLRAAAEASARLLYLPETVADKQWRRHGPGQKRPTQGRTVPTAWWADIQDILDTVVPVKQENGRWRYDNVARGRQLVVDRNAAGRLVVISYHPRQFPDA